ncbi:tetratricopeptide repeat protein [uncultured Cohaesibacter sp.]|uniref:tetratricopeptide repeat protein n=1 Tax=uncultured Cohaesibacter sp. TaxID=1002546 RepID=UPI00292ECF2E|nr:tetratricopeptide repeat protein [uncultured Cohaesibacter sp.]
MAKIQVDNILRKANSLAKKGKFAEARENYELVLQDYPNNKRAMKGLMALGSRGANLGEGTSLDRDIDLLKQMFAQKRFREVIQGARSILKIEPKNFLVSNILALAYMQTGQFEDAVKAFDKALASKPDHIEAHLNKGHACQFLGKLEEARLSFENALSIQPDLAQAHNNIGNVLQKQRKFAEAEAAYRKALEFKPEFPEALYNLGHALQEQRKLSEARDAYANAIAVRSDIPEAHHDLGTVLCELKEFEEAVSSFEKAIALRSDFFVAHNSLGHAYFELEDFQNAIESCNKALSIRPDYAKAYSNLGIINETLGNKEQALEAFRKALSLKPDYAEVHFGISRLTRYTPQDPQIVQVEQFLKDPNQSLEARCLLHYTSAKMCEDIGNLECALKNYIAGGHLRQKQLGYDFRRNEETFSNIEKAAPSIKESTLQIGPADRSVTPIFILGMPRSGTTLVEQIISSHSLVKGAGELEFVSKFGKKLSLGTEAASPEALHAFRQNYLNAIKGLSKGAPFVTDKMPHNFLHIGLILAALPEARILHIKRDAAAICWSNFKSYFVANGLGYSYDLESTVKYYGLYEKLMAYWKEMFGDQIFEVDYDALTDDQEKETRRLIKHLQLDWESSCLSPHKNKRVVRTVSNQQVREKVYKGSSQSWRKFEPLLEGIFETLPKAA